MNYFDKLKQIFTEAFNDSEGLKEGGSVDRIPDVANNRLYGNILLSTGKNTGGIAIPRPDAAAANLNLSTTIPPGQKFKLKGVFVSCDRPYNILLTVRKSESMTFNNTAETTPFSLGEHQSAVFIEFNEILYEGGQVIIAASPLKTGTDTQAYLTMKMVGEASSMYQVDNADYNICVLGDSKPLSTIDTGAYGERYYPNQLANYLINQGKSVSIIDKTMPGSSASDGVKFIKSGALDGFNYDLLVVAFGSNNAATTASAPVLTQFKTDLTEAITHRNRRNKSASIIFMTPGATDKTSWLTNIGAYRTAVSELVTEQGGSASKIYLCNEHLAITVPATPKSDKFISTEAIANQVHYSMLGHDEVFNNRFLPAVKTTDFYLNTLNLVP